MIDQNKWGPALWGGLFIGVISGVPILNLVNCACCAGVIGGGVFTVYLYRRKQTPEQFVSIGEGAVLGLMAGVVGAIIAAVLSGIFSHVTVNFLDFLMQYLNDPDIDLALKEYNSKVLMGGTFIAGLMLSLIINSIFGLVGGILGAALLGKAKMV